MIQFLDSRLPDRFWSKCIPEPNSGCWFWTAGLDRNGYGKFKVHDRSNRAYRYAWTCFFGPVTSETLDHLCANKLCCNPAHLEPVSRAENTRRWARTILSCRKGHAFSTENTYEWHNKRGGITRCCRACNRVASRKRVRKVVQS